MGEVAAALAQTSGVTPVDLQPSIAVLPFANMSRDPDDKYFSDGLAEEIINVLAHVSGLKVIARTSAFAFKGKHEDIRGIARALDVTNILEGSVRRAGSRVRITAQLISAKDGTHLWSERYDRELTDVFAIQDDIASAIAVALQVTLAGTPAYKPDPRAYRSIAARAVSSATTRRRDHTQRSGMLQASDRLGRQVPRHPTPSSR